MKPATRIMTLCKYCKEGFFLNESTYRARMKAGFMPQYCCQAHYIADIKNVFQPFSKRKRNLEIAYEIVVKQKHWSELVDKYHISRQRISAIVERYRNEVV